MFSGKAWISDYGNPDDPDDFDFIFPLSPLHNIPKDKILPPTILLTADRTPSETFMVSDSSIHLHWISDDDRVVPMHSFKYAAELQHSHAQNPHPLLLRVEKMAGHGAGKSTQQK